MTQLSEEERSERQEKADGFLAAMESFLRPEVRQIIETARQGLNASEYSIEIPDPESVDLTIEHLASLVARTSNAYSRAARLNGMVRAQLKISEAGYKRVFKQSKTGRNEDEREMTAMKSASLEHSELAIVEATAEIADALERAARVSSESARKIYDKVVAQATAERRIGSVSP